MLFTGSITALITPFRNGQLDEFALRKIVNWQIAQGAHGLVPMGTTGESPTVSEAEHKRVIEIVIEEANKRVPVIAGAGSNNPIEAIKYAVFAEQAGADAVLAVAGYYNKPSQAGLYAHFEVLHNATTIPIIVYNIPPRTIVDIQPDTMAQLAELPRIIGVKDATMDLARISLERMRIHKPFSFLSGEDMTALAYHVAGGQGCISVTANVVPGLCARMQSLCAEGRYVEARDIHERLVPLNEVLFRMPNPAGIKYAASLLDLCSAECRLPMMPVDETNKRAIAHALAAFSSST